MREVVPMQKEHEVSSGDVPLGKHRYVWSDVELQALDTNFPSESELHLILKSIETKFIGDRTPRLLTWFLTPSPEIYNFLPKSTKVTHEFLILTPDGGRMGKFAPFLIFTYITRLLTYLHVIEVVRISQSNQTVTGQPASDLPHYNRHLSGTGTHSHGMIDSRTGGKHGEASEHGPTPEIFKQRRKRVSPLWILERHPGPLTSLVLFLHTYNIHTRYIYISKT